MRKPEIIDAEFEVIADAPSGAQGGNAIVPRRHEPILQPGWYIGLTAMLGPAVILFLIKAWQNHHWPFG